MSSEEQDVSSFRVKKMGCFTLTIEAIGSSGTLEPTYHTPEKQQSSY
jgi:hypothetical protein